ncbi:MAG: ester cyclase [Ferruginibacter sp.]
MNEMNYQDYDVILDVFKAFQEQKMDEASNCLDPNFKSVILNEQVKKEEYVEMYRRIKEGMPDAKFTIVDLMSDGDVFKLKIKVTGTHTGVMPSMKKGWKTSKPTGKKINKIVTSLEIVLRGSNIYEIRNCVEGKGIVSGVLDGLHLLPKSYSAN